MIKSDSELKEITMTKKLFSVIAVIMAAVLLLTGCDAFTMALQTLEMRQKETAPPTQPAIYEEPLIPFDVLVGYDQYTTPQISADGSQIMYRYDDNFIMMNWRTGEKKLISYPWEAVGIPMTMWAPDGYTVLFFVDDKCDENFGLYTSDTRTGKTATILPGGTYNCYYVAPNPDNDDEIYMCILNREYSVPAYDLHLLNYKTGDSRIVMKNPGDITGYRIDCDGKPRLVMRSDGRGGTQTWIREKGESDKFNEDEWIQLLSWDYQYADTSTVFGFMQDNTRILYIDSASGNTSSLYTYDVYSEETKLIFNDPDYDMYAVWTDLNIDEVTAVTTMGAYIDWHILDESFEDDYEALSAISPVFDIVGSSEDDAVWVVRYFSDVKSEDYYVYDMHTKQAEFLYNARPELERYAFAPMEPFFYTASDGLIIEGYVTFPAGERENLPTVVVVHGGPWARDIWGFNFEVQLLANRGYAVIQVNFRGSTGYGNDFIRAGDREWGGKMHQDILDAVSYAIAQGWTDSERVGVYGASYGGYEALICAAFSSDVFACAVDMCGPSSLITMIEELPDQWLLERDVFIKSVGDPKTDEEYLKSRSPLYFADQMDIPLLIAQGGNDPRVKPLESDQMVDALDAAGKMPIYLMFSDTGHGLSTTEYLHEFYSTLEAFFAEHLGGRLP